MQPPRRRLRRLTDRLTLGRTGLRVSPACLGMVGSRRTIAAAFEAGINFFFLTADMHWPYYESARRGLQQLLSSGAARRDQIVVAAACYPTQPEFCAMPFLEVLEAVPQLERIDVGVMGGAYARDFEARLVVYRRHRATRHAGFTAIGASFHDRRAARAAIATRQVDVAYVRYNAAHPGARRDLFPYLAGANRAKVFNFKSTMGFVPGDRFDALGIGPEFWRPRITDYYRFALTRPEIDGVLCAFDQPRHVDEFARALEAGPLDAEEEQYLIDLADLDRGRATLKA